MSDPRDQQISQRLQEAINLFNRALTNAQREVEECIFTLAELQIEQKGAKNEMPDMPNDPPK